MSDKIQIYETEEVRKAPRKKELWERQPGESSRAFLAFVKYRDMGRDRTAAKAAVELGVTHHNLAKLSLLWNWKIRTQAWDDEMDTVKLEAIKKEIEKMVERHAKTAQIFLTCLQAPAETWLRRMQDNPKKMKNMDDMDIEKLFGLIVRSAAVINSMTDVERKSRGEATQIVDQDITSGGEKVQVILPSIPAKID